MKRSYITVACSVACGVSALVAHQISEKDGAIASDARFQDLLSDSPVRQMQALEALRHKPLLVENQNILRRIVDIALTTEDYSEPDALIAAMRDGNISVFPEDPELDMRLRVREAALLIGVANGDPAATATMEKLRQSGSATERGIAASAERYFELHGSSKSPKEHPLLYGPRLLPFEAFVARVRSDLDSGDIARATRATEHIVRSILTPALSETSRETLTNLLAVYCSTYNGSPGSEAFAVKLSAIRAATFAGGSTAKELLIKESRNSNSTIAEHAVQCLRALNELHPNE